MNTDEALSILGLESSASEQEINKRFRTLAKEKHPDKGGDVDEYKKLSEAYEYLKNPPAERQANQGWSGFWPFGSQVVGFRRARVKMQQPPPPIITSVHLSFKESVLGCNKKINVKRRTRCNNCNGLGEFTTTTACNDCGGKGQVVQHNKQGNHAFTYIQTCSACGGVGYECTKCDDCDGNGGIETDSEFDVKLRGGLINGNIVRLAGAGHYYNYMGHSAGEVMININVEDAPGMRLQGRDVISNVYISLLDSLKGTIKNVKTIDGKSELKIAPGTKHKDQVRLKGFGVQRRGDHIFNVNVEYPQDTKPLIELLEKKE